jgi:hypothetical protein
MGNIELRCYSNDSSIGETMPTYKYNGEDTREFPTIGLTVKGGDTFEAPADFDVANVSLVSKKTAPITTTEESE